MAAAGERLRRGCSCWWSWALQVEGLKKGHDILFLKNSTALDPFLVLLLLEHKLRSLMLFRVVLNLVHGQPGIFLLQNHPKK